MTPEQTSKCPENLPSLGVRSVWPAVILLTLAVAYTLSAQSYGATSALAPTLVGTATATLCLLDVASRLNWSPGRVIRIALGADFRKPEMAYEPSRSIELRQVVWVVAYGAATLAAGILPAAFGFVTAYMRVRGNYSWARSLGAAAGFAATLWLVFEGFLNHKLYQGLFLDPFSNALW